MKTEELMFLTLFRTLDYHVINPADVTYFLKIIMYYFSVMKWSLYLYFLGSEFIYFVYGKDYVFYHTSKYVWG